jgi:3',5'-cyclic AMP phosphodiesterase CpdA
MIRGMTLIAHLSDLHLVEADHQHRDASGRFRLSFLSFGRKLDEQDRRQRLRAALWSYQRSEAEHLVVTGDLTEDGTDAQFELLAEVFAGSGIDPHEVTFTAGNHDAYHDRGAFGRALLGPLRPFAATSQAGALTVLDDVAIIPISTAISQPITRSAGVIPDAHLHWVEHVTKRFQGSRRAVAIAQHHQPYRYPVAALNWIDGLQNHASAMGLLQNHAELHVLHGHRHRSSDRPVAMDGPARVFGTTACVEHPTPLRIYAARDGRLWPIDPPVCPTPVASEVPAAPLVAARA